MVVQECCVNGDVTFQKWSKFDLLQKPKPLNYRVNWDKTRWLCSKTRIFTKLCKKKTLYSQGVPGQIRVTAYLLVKDPKVDVYTQ